MLKRISLFVVILLSVYSQCLGQAGSNEAKQLIDALRNQMLTIKSLNAQYSVKDTGQSGRTRDFEITYSKDNDKVNISEAADAEKYKIQTVYNGINVQRYILDPTDKPDRHGEIFRKDPDMLYVSENDIFGLCGFALTNPKSKNANFEYRIAGEENVDGRICKDVVIIAPYLEGIKAYSHYWIETAGDKFYLHKENCLIDDDPNLLLYEKRFTFNETNRNLLPEKIYYERYEINSKREKKFYYRIEAVVKSIQVNPQIEPSIFEFYFPQGTTVVNLSTLSGDQTSSTNQTIPQNTNVWPPKQEKGKTIFNYDPNFDVILLPVIYKGNQLLFVLDTGLSITAFDSSFAKELGKPVKTGTAETSGGKTVLAAYNAPEAYLGPYNLKDYNEVLCTDMTMLSFVAGEKISGIIGMNFLKKHCVQIDADNSKLTIYNSPLERTDNLGQQFSLKFEMDIPFLYSSIDDFRQVPFLIDSGADSDIQLQANEFDNLVKNKKLQTTETLAETAAGTVKARLARLDRFQLGEYEYKDLLLDQGGNNILGFQFLARHLVTMDFPNEKIYFKKGKNFNRINQASMSGMHALKIDDKVTVFSVDKGSPAETAGIKSQDIIISVQGKNTNQYHFSQIGDILRSGDGKKISLTIKRGDQTLNVVIALKKKI